MTRQSVPLGTTIAKIASTTPVETGVVLRFMLQEEAQRLLPEEKVFQCLRRLAPINQRMGDQSPVFDHVEVRYDADRNHACYRNLILCDRVWICPVCASRISEIRRQALTAAINQAGLNAYMATYTIQHYKHTPLAVTLDTILAAYRKMKSGRWFTQFSGEYGWVGDIRSLEITYGANGWHPHIHVVTLVNRFLGKQDLSALENVLKARFSAIVAGLGGYATHANGVRVTDDNEYLRSYIAKFGRMPEKEHRKGWTIEHELTGANRKSTRGKEGFTPWALLYQSTLGDNMAAEKFLEYAKTTKGKNQLVWSRGLRSRLGMDIYESALQNQENQAVPLMTIDKYWWSAICYFRVRGELLAKVKELRGDFAAIELWLIDRLKEKENEGK